MARNSDSAIVPEIVHGALLDAEGPRQVGAVADHGGDDHRADVAGSVTNCWSQPLSSPPAHIATSTMVIILSSV